MKIVLALISAVGLARAKPVLTYFPVAARGEVARLYAIVGGVDIVDSTNTTGYKAYSPIGYLPAISQYGLGPRTLVALTRTIRTFGKSLRPLQPVDRPWSCSLCDSPEAGLFPKCAFAFGCLQESLAVERYVREISPRFQALTPQQKAVDDMFAQIKEDLMATEPGALNASLASGLATKYFDRYLAVLEHDGYIPESGFVHGLTFPTGADLSVLVFIKATFPFAAVQRNAKYDGASHFPKVYALADRTAAYPAVADYLKKSKTFYNGL